MLEHKSKKKKRKKKKRKKRNKRGIRSVTRRANVARKDEHDTCGEARETPHEQVVVLGVGRSLREALLVQFNNEIERDHPDPAYTR
jgi:hypothetical protein